MAVMDPLGPCWGELEWSPFVQRRMKKCFSDCLS